MISRSLASFWLLKWHKNHATWEHYCPHCRSTNVSLKDSSGKYPLVPRMEHSSLFFTHILLFISFMWFTTICLSFLAGLMSNFAIRISSMEVIIQSVLLSNIFLQPVMKRAHVNTKLGLKGLFLRPADSYKGRKKWESKFPLDRRRQLGGLGQCRW